MRVTPAPTAGRPRPWGRSESRTLGAPPSRAPASCIPAGLLLRGLGPSSHPALILFPRPLSSSSTYQPIHEPAAMLAFSLVMPSAWFPGIFSAVCPDPWAELARLLAEPRRGLAALLLHFPRALGTLCFLFHVPRAADSLAGRWVFIAPVGYSHENFGDCVFILAKLSLLLLPVIKAKPTL